MQYEVALAIETGELVWVQGGFAPEIFNDLSIFQAGLKRALDASEKVVSDDGYSDERCVTPMTLNADSTRFFCRRARSARNCQRAVQEMFCTPA